MIGILDLQLGNLRSVANSVYEVGADYLVINKPNQFDDVSHLIIPGVGHFSAAMDYLQSTQLLSAIKNFQESKRPMLGICLGMQIFATTGYEGGVIPGLNFIPGVVKRFEQNDDLRVPHIGWNRVSVQKPHAVLEGIKDQRDFYFVHSYHYICEDKDQVYGTTEYGECFPSLVAQENVMGMQFHPEKSQKNGLKLLENFCRWDGQC